MRRCERRCEDEKVWEKVWRGADVKRSRCEDEKVWRWEDVKMRRCEDEQMCRWEGVREDVNMRRCEDEKVWEKVWRWEGVKMRRCERRCEDEKVWRWEDEIQTPTIGRTLRSDALGKKFAGNFRPCLWRLCHCQTNFGSFGELMGRNNLDFGRLFEGYVGPCAAYVLCMSDKKSTPKVSGSFFLCIFPVLNLLINKADFWHGWLSARKWEIASASQCCSEWRQQCAGWPPFHQKTYVIGWCFCFFSASRCGIIPDASLWVHS